MKAKVGTMISLIPGSKKSSEVKHSSSVTKLLPLVTTWVEAVDRQSHHEPNNLASDIR